MSDTNDPPPAIDWASKSNEEILADVGALVATVVDGAHWTDRGPVRITATARNADALWRALGLRRTRSGQWTIDGRRYRTKRLALDSMHDRLVRRLVLRARGRIDAADIRGTIVV